MGFDSATYSGWCVNLENIETHTHTHACTDTLRLHCMYPSGEIENDSAQGKEQGQLRENQGQLQEKWTYYVPLC